MRFLADAPGAPHLYSGMIPLHDDNPTHIFPVVTVGLIAVCVAVFFWQLSLPGQAAQQAVYSFGLIPAVLFGDARLPAELVAVPPAVSILTSMFLHGGWMHLIGNMLYLWIFGNNIEDSMGHARFIVFYVLCGVAAALTQALQDPASTIPMIGASGAIGGVLGAYALLFPRAHVLVLVPLGFFITTVRVPALLVLGFWFVLQFIQQAMIPAGQGGVAHWAHIGGFVAGMVLIVPFKHRSVPLFGGPRAGSPRPPSGPGQARRSGSALRFPRSGRRGPWS